MCSSYRRYPFVRPRIYAKTGHWDTRRGNTHVFSIGTRGRNGHTHQMKTTSERGKRQSATFACVHSTYLICIKTILFCQNEYRGKEGPEQRRIIVLSVHVLLFPVSGPPRKSEYTLSHLRSAAVTVTERRRVPPLQVTSDIGHISSATS